MATTSFTKNFKVTNQDSGNFVKVMMEKPKQLIPDDFKSSYAHINKNYASKLKESVLNGKL